MNYMNKMLGPNKIAILSMALAEQFITPLVIAYVFLLFPRRLNGSLIEEHYGR